MTTETYHFKVGDFNCIAINDGYLDSIAANEFFDGAQRHELQTAFEQHNVPPGNLPIPVIILYIDTGDHRILVDTGCGRDEDDPKVGLLMSLLKFEGIKPEGIDTVVLSHGHWDHLGGNTNPDGRLAFPNARYVIARNEYTYWITEADPQENAITFKNLTYIREQVDLIGPDDEIVPGMRAIHTPGHTLHHTSFAVTSGDDTLYCLIDTVDHPIHFEHIDWTPSWDLDREQSIESRHKLFGQAARENALVHGFHLPFPGLGHLTETGPDSWRFEPVEAS